MKRLSALIVLALCIPLGAHAQEQQVVQLFGCTLNEGKTYDNVWSLVDTIRNMNERIESDDAGAGSFLWTPFRGATPYDYIIGLINTSLIDLADGVMKYYSVGGEAMDAEFQATGDCISAIVFSEQVRNGSIGNTADRQLDAVVETFGCRFAEDADMDDIREAGAFWSKQVDKIGSAELSKYEAYLWTPYRGGTGQSDFTWVGNYPDLATWAAGETAYYGSDRGQEAEEKFAEVSTECGSALWGGYWIVPPAAGPTAE